ncbi:MAG: hypothetical protein PHI59_06160 [Candidatus Omnitrophica bacterium]|nr:hypothetical protein [Candidatus Omnitrophota bacterium]
MAKTNKVSDKMPARQAQGKAKGPSKTGEVAKTIMGLFFLPIVVSVSVTFYKQFGAIDAPWSVEQQYFMMGMITYAFIHLLVFKPSYIYVFGHESVHVLATWLCLGKVKSFKVSSNGGSVSTSKNNIFISLSPYFVPFYSILLAIVIYMANNVFLENGIPYKYFLFFLGLTLSLHIVMTIDSLKTKQPDLVKTGYLISAIIIFVINMIIISGVLGLMTKGFSFTAFMTNAWNLTVEIYQRIFEQLFLPR